MHTPPRRIAVAGGGPAGLFAALRAAQCGANVTLFEQQSGPGAKLLASGGGRANITNTLPPHEFVERFGDRKRFIGHALRTLPREQLLAMLAGWGIVCEAPDQFHYFPKSQSARDILNAILRALHHHGVEIRTGVAVSTLQPSDDGWLLTLSDASPFFCQAVILATGGIGYPELCEGSRGYALAKTLGHPQVRPVPGLCGMATLEEWPRQSAGITLPGMQLNLTEHPARTWTGDLLFTHHGVSGPCILDASATLNRLLLNTTQVHITCRRTTDPTGGKQEIQDHSKIRQILRRAWPDRMADALCRTHALPEDRPFGQCTKACRETVQQLITEWPLTITGSDGFRRAMVTSGGIALPDIHPKTLESRLAPGIYFAGEMLDVDGPCGGFNLQWAFSSGWLAGASAASRHKHEG